jgi:predicted signal transduction protein with EAL and GGDEF domain
MQLNRDVLIIKKIERFACMSSNILMIDDADSVRSRIIGALKKVDLFEHYREARNGIDGCKSLIAEARRGHMPKPFDIGELVARVKMQLKIKTLQDKLKRSNELFREFSDTDPLTHLYNRRNLTKILKSELTRTKRNNKDLPFIIHDIDNFKKVNDIYGHQNGDKVLTNVADAIRAKRSYDLAARYGSEEFGTVNINV